MTAMMWVLRDCMYVDTATIVKVSFAMFRYELTQWHRSFDAVKVLFISG